MAQPALSHHIAALGAVSRRVRANQGPKGSAHRDLRGVPAACPADHSLRRAGGKRGAEPGECGFGTVTLGLLGSTSTALAPILLKAVCKRFPKVMMSVAQNSTDVLRSRIESGELDLAVSLSGFASAARRAAVAGGSLSGRFTRDPSPGTGRRFLSRRWQSIRFSCPRADSACVRWWKVPLPMPAPA